MYPPVSSMSGHKHTNSSLLDADLSVAYAKKYIQQLKGSKTSHPLGEHEFVDRRRRAMADHLLASLRSISATAWNQTEKLLAQEIVYHGIEAELIDPWEISGGLYHIYKYAIEAYAQQHPPHRLVTTICPRLGKTRQQATATDPRVIGFVAMQYHYTGMQLMEMLPEAEQENFASYVKVLDDHLYLPLHRAYEAAAQHAPDSLVLQTVRALMSNVDRISDRIVERVIQRYPRYRCYSGLLSKPTVRISSVRDVAMFQAYMWVCLLEGSPQALQEELFPLCVMIYPRLNVSWELVRQMTCLLRKEVALCLQPEQARYCEPYYEILVRIFSPEVFPNL